MQDFCVEYTNKEFCMLLLALNQARDLEHDGIEFEVSLEGDICLRSTPWANRR